MSIAVLDINDASLSLWRGAERTLLSPGYALLEGKQYRFGEAARDQARLHPRQINHRFWSQLDMEPLTPAFGPGRHHADLVHAHLLAIHEEAGRPDSLVIAAPGSLQHDQLALLLGIIEACPFSVSGLVDRAVAATAQVAASAYNWHIELQLNQALLTGMRWEDGLLIRDNMVPIPGSGWLAVQENLARAIADAFIQQTRFDPRRSAKSEQSLYDQLPALLQRLQQSGETNLDIEGRQARIERSRLAEACDSHYQRIVRTVAAGDAQVMLGASLENLPGLKDQLADAVTCSAEAVSQGVESHSEAILADASGVRFITSLAAKSNSSAAASTPQVEPAPSAPQPGTQEPGNPENSTAATVAERIAPGSCQIELVGGNATLSPLPGPPITVNGRSIQGREPLHDGDVIEFADGTAWRLVAAGNRENDGTQT